MQQNEVQSKAINAELVNVDCDDTANSSMEGQNKNSRRKEISQDAIYQNGKQSVKGNFLRKDSSNTKEYQQVDTSPGNNLSTSKDIESPLFVPSNVPVSKEGTNANSTVSIVKYTLANACADEITKKNNWKRKA